MRFAWEDFLKWTIVPTPLPPWNRYSFRFSQNTYLIGIGASIRIGQEIWSFLYPGFFLHPPVSMISHSTGSVHKLRCPYVFVFVCQPPPHKGVREISLATPGFLNILLFPSPTFFFKELLCLLYQAPSFSWLGPTSYWDIIYEFDLSH